MLNLNTQNTNLVFNLKKTKSMLFSMLKMSQHHHLVNDGILTVNSNNQQAEKVEQNKLLGIIIVKHFELCTHIRKKLKDGYSKMKILKKG